MVNPALAAAAQFGDRALFDTMVAELEKTTDRQQRGRILSAMSSFRAPIARAALNMVIHSDLDIRESLALLFGPLGQVETENFSFEFIKANYDELLKRLPTGAGMDAGAALPFVAGNSCSEASRLEFVSFFEERAPKFTGGQHNYDQVLESIRLCEARKSARAPASPPSSRSSRVEFLVVLQIRRAKQAGTALLLPKPAVHAGPSDVSQCKRC